VENLQYHLVKNSELIDWLRFCGDADIPIWWP